MTKNDVLRVVITGWSSDGAGLCRVGSSADGRDMVVFVAGGVPGDECDVRVLKVAKTHAFGKIERLHSPSSLRDVNECRVYPRCGGCDLRHVSYAAELEFKRGRVEDALRRIGGADVDVPPVLPSERVEGYRNKTVFQIESIDGEVRFGFFRKHSHDIEDGGGCLINTKKAVETARVFCREAARARVFDARWLQYRENAAGEGQLVIVTRGGSVSGVAAVAQALRTQCAWLTGVLYGVNATEEDNVALRGDVSAVWGEERLTDTLGGFEFDISPQSFFQVNRASAERLYEIAAEFAGLSGRERVLDLYCGIGTLTLALARGAAWVDGAEVANEAVADARGNAERNGVANVRFLCGDAGEIAAQADVKYDVVVVDPPRKGLSGEALAAVGGMGAPRVVYVSCDPATLARDVKLFAEYGYRVARVQAVDMFPRTRHVETVVLLVNGGY